VYSILREHLLLMLRQMSCHSAGNKIHKSITVHMVDKENNCHRKETKPSQEYSQPLFHSKD